MFRFGAVSCRKCVFYATVTVRKQLRKLHLFLYLFSQVLKRELVSKQVRRVCRNRAVLWCIGVRKVVFRSRVSLLRAFVCNGVK